MDIIVTKDQETRHVSVMKLRGSLDGNTYEHFIREAEELYDSGVRNLLVDMTNLSFLSSAGLAALHRVALIYRGEDRSTLPEGWAAMHAIGRDRENGMNFQEHIKLLHPNEKIRDVLDTVGFQSFFEIFEDIHPAIASFQ